MAVPMTKVRQEAPHLAPVYEQMSRAMIKGGKSGGLQANRDQAAVRIYLDHSGSTEQFDQKLYSARTHQLGDDRVSEMEYAAAFGVAGGLFLDDDARIPFNLFDTRVTPLGVATLENHRQLFAEHRKYGYGGTSYLAVFRHVLKECGYDQIRLDDGGSLAPKAQAAYPDYVAVYTDGEPDADSDEEIVRQLTLMSQLPIFWQFVGVGNHSFRFLKRLDKLKGRLIDNAGFFDLKDREARSAEGIAGLMAKEFAGSYYPGSRSLGLITG